VRSRGWGGEGVGESLNFSLGGRNFKPALVLTETSYQISLNSYVYWTVHNLDILIKTDQLMSLALLFNI